MCNVLFFFVCACVFVEGGRGAASQTVARGERRADNQLDEANESVMMKERGVGGAGGAGREGRGCRVEKC